MRGRLFRLYDRRDGLEQDQGNSIIHYALAEDDREKLGLFLVFDYGNGGYDVGGAQQGADEEALQDREGERDRATKSLGICKAHEIVTFWGHW